MKKQGDKELSKKGPSTKLRFVGILKEVESHLFFGLERNNETIFIFYHTS